MIHPLQVIFSYLKDFFHLIFPNICQACENQLAKGEQVICLMCQVQLPQTDYHLDKDNRVAKHFWGRAEIERATSFYFYTKGGKVQKLIYKLKYQGHKEIGIRMGQLFAGLLKESGFLDGIDLIIPVPLHVKKKRKRGFNQCDTIAEGMSGVLRIPWSDQLLERKIPNVSQTGKSRYSRWENVDDIFKVLNRKQVQSKHILLVDDVITTGSTLEACAVGILKVPGTTVSIATIACAN